MTASAYNVDKDGKENRILFWLRLDEWNLCDAALLFADINPESVNLRKNDFTELVTLKNGIYNLFDSTDEFVKLNHKYDDLCRILLNPDIECDTPQNWIDRALAKKIAIPWLDFAIQNDFYESKTKSPQVEKLIDIYNTDLLDILNQAANQFFNPRKNLDAKKEEVTEWIINKGNERKIKVAAHVAGVMFTIIKPNDHNPKIKRA